MHRYGSLDVAGLKPSEVLLNLDLTSMKHYNQLDVITTPAHSPNITLYRMQGGTILDFLAK